MSLEQDIARLKLQEEKLHFTKFNEDDAWAIGSAMRIKAQAKQYPFVIDIRVAGRKMFYTALPGTAPENERWVERKINVVNFLHKSSYRVGRELAQKDRALDANYGVNPADFAPHGGCFPIIIAGVGAVGTITVSGIPQRDDHNFVVEAICEHLKINYHSVALADE